jgi:hypothetical protein
MGRSVCTIWCGPTRIGLRTIGGNGMRQPDRGNPCLGGAPPASRPAPPGSQTWTQWVAEELPDEWRIDVDSFGADATTPGPATAPFPPPDHDRNPETQVHWDPLGRLDEHLRRST